jgi:hypothetical protein
MLLNKEPSYKAQAIDAQVAKEMTCICGHKGMRYRCETEGRTYHAIAVCPECGHEEEF